MLPVVWLFVVWFGLALAVIAKESQQILDGDEAFGRSVLLDRIEVSGTVRIGVKTDFPPFGFLDASGNPIGYEIDLAHRLAERLGVRAEIVPVTTENRFQRLEQGLIDILVATAADTRERRALATVVEPNYYGAGVTVLLRPEVMASEWQDIRGQTLCGLQGAYFNRPMTERHILEIQRYRSIRDAQLALQDRRCIGFLYTDVAIAHWLEEPEWAGYVAPFESALIVPWSISLPRTERGTRFEQQVGDSVAAWHRDGTLIELEQIWGVRSSPFLRDAQRRWLEKDAAGEWVCRRQADGQWPVDCRNPAFVTAEDVEGLRSLGLWVRDTLGIHLSILYDPHDSARYVRGLLLTIALSMISLVLALVLGYLMARLLLSGSAWIRWPASGLAYYLRMTPPLLLMYLVFFGLGGLLPDRWDWALSPFSVAVLCLGAYHASMVAFALVDAARIVHQQAPEFVLRLDTLPQLLAGAAVGIRTAMTNLIKATGIASAIAVPELLSATLAIIADRGNVNVMMNLLLVVFYFLTALWIAALVWVERRILRKVAKT